MKTNPLRKFSVIYPIKKTGFSPEQISSGDARLSITGTHYYGRPAILMFFIRKLRIRFLRKRPDAARRPFKRPFCG